MIFLNEQALAVQKKMVAHTKKSMALPFDQAKQAYATAVNMGLSPRSMLACRDISKLIERAEVGTLGVFARTK